VVCHIGWRWEGRLFLSPEGGGVHIGGSVIEGSLPADWGWRGDWLVFREEGGAD